MYGIRQDGDGYILEKDSVPVTTPMGQPVRTPYKVLADRLVADLEKHGEDPTDPISLVAFHYAMLDFFNLRPRADLEHTVAVGLDPECDWTFHCPTAMPVEMMNRKVLFGGRENIELGKEWLASLSLLQLCAVCVLGKAMDSVNIPFIVASKLPPKAVTEYAKAIASYNPYANPRCLSQYFKNFLFYFHLEDEAQKPPKKKTVRGGGKPVKR